jgi:hypothetical protein
MGFTKNESEITEALLEEVLKQIRSSSNEKKNLTMLAVIEVP